jgi:hypothetical protein
MGPKFVRILVKLKGVASGVAGSATVSVKIMLNSRKEAGRKQ